MRQDCASSLTVVSWVQNVKNMSANLIVKRVDNIETICCRIKVNFVDCIVCVVCNQTRSMLVLNIEMHFSQVPKLWKNSMRLIFCGKFSFP